MDKTESSYALLSRAVIISGREDILAHRETLEQLARHCGKATAMHGLEYYFNRPENLKKQPHLVIVSSRPQHSSNLDPASILGAALFYEYQLWGIGTGVMVSPDYAAHRAVIAEPERCAQIGSLACSALLRETAHIVLCSFQQQALRLGGVLQAADANPPFSEQVAGRWAFASREIPDSLQLNPTYDETLAKLGKRTRHHLRLFRKRIEQHTPCHYIADATARVSAEELSSLNANSLNPIPDDAFRLQWESCVEQAGGFISGLRTTDGQWLSLIGGWRQDDTTLLQWQMNTAGYERFSLSIAARAFFLEHEIAQGARSLRIEGGTPHSLSNSFSKVRVVDLIVRRRSLRATIYMLVAAVAARMAALIGKRNFVVDCLCHKDLDWQPMNSVPSSVVPPQPRRPRVPTRYPVHDKVVS